MFARYVMSKRIARILREEFAFAPESRHQPALDAVTRDAIAQSLNAYEAAVMFMLEELRVIHDHGVSGNELVPVTGKMAHMRIGAIARLIDQRKVSPTVVDSGVGHALRELRQVYA